MPIYNGVMSIYQTRVYVWLMSCDDTISIQCAVCLIANLAFHMVENILKEYCNNSVVTNGQLTHLEGIPIHSEYSVMVWYVSW